MRRDQRLFGDSGCCAAASRDFVGVAACAVSPKVATAKRAAIEAMPELLQRVLKAIARSLLLLMGSHDRPRGHASAADQRREPVSDSGKILQPGARLADLENVRVHGQHAIGHAALDDRYRVSIIAGARRHEQGQKEPSS